MREMLCKNLEGFPEDSHNMGICSQKVGPSAPRGISDLYMSLKDLK
jgi:hypothetical protein